MKVRGKARVIQSCDKRSWTWGCTGCNGHPFLFGNYYPTHAEALAAAWAHIKEHS